MQKIDDPEMFEKVLRLLAEARELEHDYIYYGIDYAFNKHVKDVEKNVTHIP